jgi:protein-disulfide isomerase
VLEQHPKEIKLVHKDFPIPSHKFSKQAAVAARAAGDQNKYWEYHDKLFQNLSALNPEKFLQIAKELSLNIDAFKKSIADPIHLKHIEKDLQEAANAGVQGTPTIFFNGRLLSAHTLDGYRALIDEELKQKK